MQRKISILNTSHRGGRNHRNGMALIMAIVVLVVIATVMAMSLALTVKTSKKTADIYLYEQAALLSQSAAEFAMLKVSQTDPCKIHTPIEFSYGGTSTAKDAADRIFDIKVTMEYVAFDMGGAPSATSCFSNTATGSRYANVLHKESNGAIIMDVTVKTKDGIVTEPIRYFRRSIQKM